MNLDASYFRALLQELIDENPFAIRAVLKILEVEFTDTVPTLAVTCEARPRLLVNLDFLRAHCASDTHVKAVICHEFLHVLLRHTETEGPLTPARHLAFDAVINAIIHRQLGPDFSDMMARYYANAEGLMQLLRPMTPRELKTLEAGVYGRRPRPPAWMCAWNGLYAGRLVVDDIAALAEDLGGADPSGGGGEPIPADFSGHMLGNHDDLGRAVDGQLEEALDRVLKQMNGDGIWRSPNTRGVGANPYAALFNATNEPLRRWKRQTLEVLRQHVSPDASSRSTREEARDYRVPVLSPGDRRAFLQALWAPYLPEATWQGVVTRPEGSAQVYLDVSGSMNAEMPLIVGLLGQLSRHIRRPFWAFSDEVAPARIVNGQLQAATSGGTRMSCVIEHLKRTRPAAAVVVTDGYIEPLSAASVRGIASTRLHAIVTRDGHPAALARAGIPYTQLGRLPS
jgi:hypothetical protein